MTHKDWSLGSLKRKPQKKEKSYPDIFDCIIIGAGPAGMTAAIYGARRKMTVLLICGKEVGGQMRWSSDISNYPGTKKIVGPALTDKFLHHVESIEHDIDHFDVWLRRKESATKIEKNPDNTFSVSTDGERTFRSKTLVITAGKVPRTLNIPGEKIAMQGNGLSFCATCDAPLYKDKKMVIIGGGNSAMDVALQLEKYTNDITIFTDIDALIGERVLMEKIEKSDSVSVKYNITVSEILLNEQNKVRGILYSENGKESQEFACTGIFEEIGQLPATSFAQDFLELNAHGEIPTNRKCETSIPGVFAAGDVTDQVHKQVIVAAGEGAIAALEAHEYILNSADL